MSGFAGVLSLDGSLVEAATVEHMGQAIQYRGNALHTSKPDIRLDFVTASLQTGTAAAYPVLEGDLTLPIAASARLTNRAALSRELGLQNSPEVSDTEIILAAYRRWGKDCVHHLSGDFAFAVWDQHENTLFCARDPVGIKQLYYWQDSSQFVFSTDIAAIMAVKGQTLPLNLTLIREFLCADTGRCYSETIYQQIFKLEPAHWLAVGASTRKEAYFLPENISPIQYRRDSDYIDHFYELFSAAVSKGVETSGTTGIQVSGGVDSSAITSLAHHHSKGAKGSTPSAVKLYSLVASERFPKVREAEYLAELMGLCADWPCIELPYDSMWPMKDHELDHDYHPDEPESGFFRRPSLEIFRAARHGGVTALVNGIGGDQVLHGDGYYSTGMINFLPWGQRLQAARHFTACSDDPSPLELYTLVARPWLAQRLPTGVKNTLRGRAGRTRAWLTMDEAPTGNSGRWRGSSSGTHADVIWNALYSGPFQKLLSWYDYLGALHHMENRYVFLDFELIKFLSGLPLDLLLRKGINKWVLRESLSGIMPEKLRTRDGFATGDELIEFGLREKEFSRIGNLIQSSRLCERGWVDRYQLQAKWSDYYRGDSSTQAELGAWLNLEQWLDS